MGYRLIIIDGYTSSSISNSCIGSYNLIVTDSNGCSASNTFSIGNIIYGCTDSLACNYDPNANTDDGSCLNTLGCTDSLSCNYNPSANCDDGSCTNVYGCTDSSAFNYDPFATCDDGSCIPVIFGCMDTLALNYDIANLMMVQWLIYNGLDSISACDSVVLSTNAIPAGTYNWTQNNNVILNNNYSMNFDGTSYYVDIGNSNQLKTPSYSFMLNFKISEHNGGVRYSDSPQS